MTPIPEWALKTNWRSFTKQKGLLLELAERHPEHADLLDGLVNWIDCVQDWLVDDLGLSEYTVFGDLEND